jgi:hypothetical protein
MKDNLHEDFWENNKLDNNVRRRLVRIVMDFFDNLGIETYKIKDITLTGSLANYNWSSFSDIDLHVIVDFGDIDDNTELVKEMLDGKRFIWNKAHNILINGFEVEIYVQDESESHESTGVYSVMSDDWLTEPEREDPEIDWENVKKKVSWLKNQIGRAQRLFDDGDYRDTYEHVIRIKDKIRRFRQSGLDREGAFSAENIAFKVLRRDGSLDTLSALKATSYDKKMSLPSGEEVVVKVGNLVEDWKKFLNEDVEDTKDPTYEVSIRVAINKATGLTKAQTFAEVRAIPGVTTVNVVPGTVAPGLTYYYETLSIRFCCAPGLGIAPGVYLHNTLIAGMKRIKGLIIVRVVGSIDII